MYNLLKGKSILTKSKKLIFKKHKYNRREYIMFLLKKNNIEDKSIVDEILKNDVNCYTKYIRDYYKKSDFLKNHIKIKIYI